MLFWIVVTVDSIKVDYVVYILTRKYAFGITGAVIIHWRYLKIDPLIYNLRNYFNRAVKHKRNT